MRILLQITVIVTVVLTTPSCKTQLQPFEGTIVYRTTIEQPENSSIPTEQFKMMFQDVDTLAQLYLKDSFYKLVTLDATTNKPKSVTLYRPDSNKIYSYMAGQNELCFASKIHVDSLPEVKTVVNMEDTALILGKVCHLMTISQESGVKNLIYYSKDYKIDKKSYEGHQVGFLRYFYETESLPLKVVMSGNGAVHEMVFTATEINKDPINDITFELPEFNEILNSGQN